jgi:hypothetical protein
MRETYIVMLQTRHDIITDDILGMSNRALRRPL